MINFLLASFFGPQMPFLSPAFSDHMVLQRDKINTIWGWSSPGEKITITIAREGVISDQTRQVAANGIAGEDGKWSIQLRPPKVGGPYVVSVSGSQSVTLHDVMVGDVWICSGQSNMEMGIAMAKDAQREIQDASNYPLIRLYTVPKVPALAPKPFPQGEWATCTPESIAMGGWGGFSAVGYYFGRTLNQSLNVPIGLIHTSWGGTPAEAWTSAEGIAPVKDFDSQAKAVKDMTAPGAPRTADMIESWANKTATDYSGNAVDDSDWTTVKLPARFGQIGLQGFRGEVWFRKTIELPNPLPQGDAQLTTGSNDGIDLNYVNGVRTDIGSSVLNWRNKPVPAGVLKPGKNVIAIRFIGTSNAPGFTFNGIDGLNLRIGGERYSLVGDWKMMKGFEMREAPKMPPLVEDNPNWPTTLFNGMINPLLPLSIKGAIWYQGESNVGRGEQYSRLLPAMIADWRKSFGQGDFPFFVVQLANFGGQQPNPGNSGWAELREAQATAVKRVKNAGLAVTVDIGEARDIHPKNKQEVGRRLALSALKIAYGKNVEFSGPTFKKATSKGSELLVTFDHANGLTLRPAKHSGFAIAGQDGKFVWAKATVQGNTVVLSADGVTAPVDVRYAWDDDPVVTLFNKEGLPAVPFRTK